MATHVVLLRGINVGGRHKLPMATVRQTLDDAGLGPVATYIQSGNIVLTSELPDDQVAARTRDLLEPLAGFAVPAVAIGVDALERVLDGNPFTPAEPKLEHVVLLPQPIGDDLAARVAALAEDGDDDTQVHAAGRAVYVHHPRGLMQSPVAQRVTALLTDGTARNLASVRAVVDLARRS